MNSPKSKHAEPIESVELQVVIKADKATLERIKVSVPAAVLSKGGCLIVLDGESPADVARMAKETFEKVDMATKKPERF